MKLYKYIIVSFVLFGCGSDILDPESYLTKNPWYEVCDNNSSKMHTFKNNIYSVITYGNSNFTNIVDKKEYIVESYTINGFVISSNSGNYVCGSTYADGGDTIIADCVKNDQNIGYKIFIANSSQKMAKENIHKCIDF